MIPQAEWATRVKLASDQYVVDGQHHFVLGQIVLRVLGTDQDFVWNVWVSLSAQNFDRMAALWEQLGREHEPPYFGWLSTALPTYPPTLNLKTLVHTQAVGVRPTIEVEPTEHPLAMEQREGIRLARVKEIAATLLHR